MGPEDWKKIKELFNAAIDLLPEEAGAFLDRACDDAGIRREVEALLAAEEDAARLLGRPIVGQQNEPPASRFAPGTILAERYRIVELVGRGGMGEVYRADDLKLKQPVALKFLPESEEGDETQRFRLIEELKIARQVSHPNVCRVYDVGENGPHLFLSMELIEGEDLASLLRRIDCPAPEEALDLARQLAAGLAAAHEQGVLHCDLKPANLMIDGRGRLRIMDFGIARAIGGPFAGGLSAVGHGTPAYMAPEQFDQAEVSPASDVYALGLVMYELFTGQRPFQGLFLEEWKRLHREETPQLPSERVVGMDSTWEKLILACLGKEPRDRPASAAEVAASLSTGGPSAGSMPWKTLLVSHLHQNRPEFATLHRMIVRKLLKDHRALEIEQGVGAPRLVFHRPIHAVRHALAYHRALRSLSEGEGGTLKARVAIHLCSSETEGLPAPTTSDLDTVERLTALAKPGQTLMTHDAFDSARHAAASGFHGVRWLAHGSYEIEGTDEPLEVYEAGEEGVAPFEAPRDGPDGRRQMVQATLSGWRPAPGQTLPGRPRWSIERRLGEGGFGEVWLAVHRQTRERRVFKFCYDPLHLRSLQREITLFRLLKETLGDRDDITRIVDWNFDQAPYYIESEYTEGGSLIEWATNQGGLGEVSLAKRLDIVARLATALAAAHSVGVLHKDVKPGNVLITHAVDSRVRARLNDFGVGLITERQRLVDAGITAVGVTEPRTSGNDFGSTRLYMAPELLEGKPPTVQADIYALGVVFFQMVVGDFSRALAPGWERDIDDELLQEDIAKAVDGDPRRRFGSARRLAERLDTLEQRRADLARRRHREEEAERLRASLLIARRRRKRAAWISVGLALFATFVTISLYSVKQEANRANREAATVQELSDLLVEMIKSSDPFKSSIDKVTARETFERGAADIESKLAASHQPLVQGKMMHTLGMVHLQFGSFEKATRFLEKSLEIRRKAHGEPHLEVVESLRDLAEVLRITADLERAEQLCDEALDLRRQIHDLQRPCTVDIMFLLGRILFNRRDFDRAETVHRDTLELRRGGDQSHCDTNVANTVHVLTATLNAQGDHEAAEEIYRELRKEQYATLGRLHPDVTRTLSGLARTLTQKGDFDEARRLYEETLNIQREVLGFDHPDITLTTSNLAQLFQREGRFSEAESLFKQAMIRFEEKLGPGHIYTAYAKYNLARLYRQTGDFEEAGDWARQALAIYIDAWGEDHPDVIQVQLELADLLTQTAY